MVFFVGWERWIVEEELEQMTMIQCKAVTLRLHSRTEDLGKVVKLCVTFTWPSTCNFSLTCARAFACTCACAGACALVNAHACAHDCACFLAPSLLPNACPT